MKDEAPVEKFDRQEREGAEATRLAAPMGRMFEYALFGAARALEDPSREMESQIALEWMPVLREHLKAPSK